MSATRASDLWVSVSNLPHALGYAKRGWPVFPCSALDKRPLTRQGFKNASTNAETIIKWWTERPYAVIGIATGQRSGLVVVDVDPRNGGDTSWAELIAGHPPIETARVNTPSGGYHLYFKAPTSQPIKKCVLAPGVDVQAEGAYVIAAGSQRGDGVPYVWDHWSEVAPLPGWLLERLRAQREPAAKAERQAGASAQAPATIAKGRRKNTLASLAGSMRRRGLTRAAIEAALLVVNQEKCMPPLPDAAVRKIARSISQYTPADDTFNASDAGNAEWFANMYGDQVRFDHRRQRWLIFSGHRWVPDSDGEIDRLALQSVRQRQVIAVTDTSLEPDARQQRAGYMLHAENRQGLRALLGIAKSLVPLADAGDQWDGDPFLLGVTNGVVDLRTGLLRDGRPEDRITLSTRVEFDPEAECPLWQKTIEEIHQDHAKVEYVQRALGYSITGDAREECFFLCWGTGANGKGTEMNTIGYVLGEYADNLSFSALELQDRSSRGATPEIAKLPGKRFVTSSESSDVARLNEARIKALTGRDPITARGLYQSEFTYWPVAKFWLAANHKPKVHDDSEGFWRRVHLIPFTQSFIGRQDNTLKDRLRAEAPGILAWLVRGCLAWQRDGLRAPVEVRQATEDYRRESETLAAFYEAVCIVGADQQVGASELFSAYQAWSGRMGLKPREQLTLKAFGRDIRKRFNAVEKHNRVTYYGVGLRPAGEVEEEHAAEMRPSRMGRPS